MLLVLATLVAGVLLISPGSDPALALGPEDDGICDYSEPMRQALIFHEFGEDAFFRCDETPFAQTNQAVGQVAWSGDLDVAPYVVGGAFVPGKGELDGYAEGSRVDLRGSDIDLADLDVSAALKAHESSPSYRPFGEEAKGTNFGNDNAGGFIGLTFLLDGDSAPTSGLANQSYSGAEDDVVWFTFQWSSIPSGFSKWSKTDGSDDADGDDGFYLVLKLHIEVEGDDKQVFFLVNSDDSARTLYAIPFRVPDDFVIERPERADVTLSAVGVFDLRSQAVEAATTSPPDYTDDEDDNFDEIEREIRGNDDARLTIADDDAPAVEVCDRSRPVRDLLVEDVGKDCDEISAHDLADLGALDLSNSEIDDLRAGDFSGLTDLGSLDLTDNDLASLPAGVFDGIGSDLDAPNVAFIDVSDNPGPRRTGFSRSNVSSTFRASVGPRQAVRLASHEFNDDPDYGLDRQAYSVGEGRTLVLGLSALAESAVLFRSLAGDTGTYEDSENDCDAPCEAPSPSQIEAEGEYLLGFAVPSDDDSRDDTFTILYGESRVHTSLDTVESIARLTVTEDGSGSGPVTPTAPQSIFETVRVVDTISVAAVGNPDLVHNISDLQVTVGGRTLPAEFLNYHNRTGQRERWGFPTSEVLELEQGTLTQFFQRGAIDFHIRHDLGGIWVTERRLAWDYFGGGAGGSVDQKFEPPPASPPSAAVFFPAFMHYVANTAADGTQTGFLDFFNSLGGVDSFGFPKTEARRDRNAPGMLSEGKTPGFMRQYFQAAIFQLAANGEVQLTLLGDSLRNLLVPNHGDYAAFRRAAPFIDGQFIIPQRII